jgi:hypothetical protein
MQLPPDRQQLIITSIRAIALMEPPPPLQLRLTIKSKSSSPPHQHHPTQHPRRSVLHQPKPLPVEFIKEALGVLVELADGFVGH